LFASTLSLRQAQRPKILTIFHAMTRLNPKRKTAIVVCRTGLRR
jgi:hypothetical protein